MLSADGVAEANVVTGGLSGAAAGNVSVGGGAALTSAGDGGGTIRIEGGAFVVDEGSLIASTNTGLTDGDVGIDIDAETIEIAGNSLVATDAQADGKGGDIDLTADDLRVSEGSVLGSNSSAAGDGGDISIAGGDVEFSNGGFAIGTNLSTGTSGAIEIQADDLALIGGNVATTTIELSSGDGGGIVIVADDIELSDRAAVQSLAFGDGDAGIIDIAARNSLQLRSASNINTSTQTLATGDAGSISVATGDLTILDNSSQIVSATFGSGAAGTIDITAETALLDAENGETFGGITTQSDGGSSGDAGAITLVIDDLTLRNTSQISSTAFGSGGAGDISITSETITIDALQANQGLLTGISTSVDAGTAESTARCRRHRHRGGPADLAWRRG